MDIITLLTGLSPVIDYTKVRQLSNIAEAMLAMTGRITLLGISRWTESSGSYRTIQRFFYSKINWGKLRWLFTRRVDKEDVILVAGDEVVVSKSGKQTYGLERFFSSLDGKTIPSICFLSLSLISVKHHRSYPLMMEQVIKTKPQNKTQESTKTDSKKTDSKKTKKGRPKGSCSKNRKNIKLSSYLLFVQATLKNLPVAGDIN